MRKRTRGSQPPSKETSTLSRINKVLAAAGLGSRRHVEELIVQGRVEIDGQVVTDLATRVDPQKANIKIDGELLKQPKLVYYALNKPRGVLSTNRDPSGRSRVIDYVPDRHRVFSVGRLDQYSEGLMLLTNDGALAQRLAHPKYRVQKTYFVVVAGAMTREELDKLRKGVYLAEGVARIDGASIRKVRKTSTELEIKLSEGKNREIRRILARAGHKVVLLRRIAIGPLRLGELPIGAARELSTQEVRALYERATWKKPQSSARRGRAADSATPNARGAESTPAFSTPIEPDATDDFGIGLDEEYYVDHSAAFSNEDELGLQFEDANEEDMIDDDFGFDLRSTKPTGKIIGSENEGQPFRKAKQPRRGKGQLDKRGAAKTSTGKDLTRTNKLKTGPARKVRTSKGPKSAAPTKGTGSRFGKVANSRKTSGKTNRPQRASAKPRSGRPESRRGPNKGKR